MSYSIRLDLRNAGPDPALTIGRYGDRMRAVECARLIADAIADQYRHPEILISLLDQDGEELPWPPCGWVIGWVQTPEPDGRDVLGQEVTCTRGYGHAGDLHEGEVPLLEEGQVFYAQAREGSQAKVAWAAQRKDTP